MTASLNKAIQQDPEPRIQLHPAWHGRISGLDAQDRLIGHAPYIYLLREGEYHFQYYVSFVRPDLTIQHQPFMIKITSHGWYCRNLTGTGPFVNQTIQEVIHLIMHCKQEECSPLSNRERA